METIQLFGGITLKLWKSRGFSSHFSYNKYTINIDNQYWWNQSMLFIKNYMWVLHVLNPEFQPIVKPLSAYYFLIYGDYILLGSVMGNCSAG